MDDFIKDIELVQRGNRLGADEAVKFGTIYTAISVGMAVVKSSADGSIPQSLYNSFKDFLAEFDAKSVR